MKNTKQRRSRDPGRPLNSSLISRDNKKTMATTARLQSSLVALLLLCCIVFSSFHVLAAVAAAAAADADNSVCTANDPREECLAAAATDDAASILPGDDEAVVLGEKEEKVDNQQHCLDEHVDCQNWSKIGECHKNPGYMLNHCKKSCKVCGIIDDNDFGTPQEIPRTDDFDAIKDIITKSTEYMKKINMDSTYDEVRHKCQNQHAHCSQWALRTGCDDNPTVMKQQCAPACQSCDFVLHMHERCKPDPNAKKAIENGGMDLLFERIIDGARDSGYEPTIWSRPKKMPNEHGYLMPCEEDVTNPCGVYDGPWVVTLENFVTQKEVDKLKEWGSELGYDRSKAADQILDVRTSSHAVRKKKKLLSARAVVDSPLSITLVSNAHCLYDISSLFSGVLDYATPTLLWLQCERRFMVLHTFQNATQNTYSYLSMTWVSFTNYTMTSLPRM